jgi:hypothetical protein
MDNQEIVFQFSTGNRKVSLSKSFLLGLVAQSASYSVGTVGFFLGSKTAGG